MKIFDMQSGRPVSLKIWDGNQWVPARGLGSQPETRSITPPTGPTRNIGSGCAFMNSPTTSAAETGSLVAARIPLVVDTAHPVAEFDVLMNEKVARTMEIRAAVSIGGGSPAPVTFNNGQPSARLERPGAGGIVHVKTDPLPIKAAAGDVLHFWGFTGAPDGGRPMGDQVGYLPGVDSWYAPAATFEAAWAGVHMTGGTNSDLGLIPGARPARILAPSNQPAWLLSGDSIMHFSRPHVQRWAIAAGVAWAKNATGGRNYIHATGEYETLYRPSVLSANMCFEALGINGANLTLGMEHWRRLRTDGIEGIVKPTLTPQSSSTDRWRTVEKQTATSDVEGFKKWDSWLLDGAPMHRDWSATAVVGATGPDIVRCAVVDHTGALIRRGDKAHIFGTGGVVDWNPSVSTVGMSPAGSRRIWRTDLGLTSVDYGDGLHPGDGIHQILADYLVKAMPVILSPEARTS